MAAPAAVTAAMTEFELGKTKYCEDQWLDAAVAFGRSIELDSSKPLPYEYKVRCHIHQARLEQTEFAGTGKGPDGTGQGKLAYDTAWRVVQKHGTTRFESLWVLAEATCLVRQYGIVSYLFQQITEHPSYAKATPGQKQAIEAHATRHAGRGFRSCRHHSRRPAVLEVVIDIPSEDPVDYGLARRGVSIEHAFSPDTLLRVVDLAVADDPNVAIRMSGVCRRWRGILVNQPGCWQKLFLGPGEHMMAKARAYLARCGGAEEKLERGLKELRIADGTDSAAIEELGMLLAPHAPFIQLLQLNIRPADARVIYSHLFHGLQAVRSLDIKYGVTATIDYGLLPPTGSRLQSLTLSNILHDNPRDRVDEAAELASDMVTWLDAPDTQLSELEVLKISDSTLSGPISSLYGILQHTPKLRQIHLSSLTWWIPPTAHYYQQAAAANPAIIRLEHLDSWVADTGRVAVSPTGYIPFQTIHVPNLTHLELVGVWAPTDTCLSAGLAEALPSLRSLIICRASLPDHFIDVLRSTPSLKFLGLITCALTPAFLERFNREANTAPHLLPSLVALSLANNAHVRTRYLREFLKGRAAKLDQEVPEPPRDGEGEGVGEGGEQRDDMSPVEAESPGGGASAEVASSFAEPQPPPIARLRWLNIDHCATVDVRYFPKFQEKLAFVSHWMGAGDDDRMRGKGKWDWQVVPDEDEGEVAKKDGKKKVRWGGERYIE